MNSYEVKPTHECQNVLEQLKIRSRLISPNAIEPFRFQKTNDLISSEFNSRIQTRIIWWKLSFFSWKSRKSSTIFNTQSFIEWFEIVIENRDRKMIEIVIKWKMVTKNLRRKAHFWKQKRFESHLIIF